MVHTLAPAGICARRNGINGGFLPAPKMGFGRQAWKEARLKGGNRLCRKFLVSIFRPEPKFAEELMRENVILEMILQWLVISNDDTHTLTAIPQVRKIEAGFIYG